MKQKARFAILNVFFLAAACWLLTAGSPVSADDFTRISVKTYGQGDPVILIPGLTCDGSVWQPTVERLKGQYALHVVSIAGFGKRPAVDGELLPKVQAELVSYIEKQGLQRPVIVGHSLGGFLGMWIAATNPDLVRGVVVVDGVPYLPALQQPGATPESMQANADQMKRMLSGLDQAMFAAQNRMTMQMFVTDSDKAAELAKMTSQSHPATVAQAMYELMTTDLRETVTNIRVPVLALVPADSGVPGLDAATVADRYRDQFGRIPKCRVEFVPDVRHFVMVDDPETFYELLKAFLQSPEQTVDATTEPLDAQRHADGEKHDG